MKVYHEAIVTYEEMLQVLELDSVVFDEKRMIPGKAPDYVNSTDEIVIQKQRSA